MVMDLAATDVLPTAPWPVRAVLIVLFIALVAGTYVAGFRLTRRIILHFRPDARPRGFSPPSTRWPNRPQEGEADAERPEESGGPVRRGGRR